MKKYSAVVYGGGFILAPLCIHIHENKNSYENKDSVIDESEKRIKGHWSRPLRSFSKESSFQL